MQIRISPQDGVPIYLQIINQVNYLVASRRLLPGEQLPPVRKLAEMLVVNPNTVARAYRELEAAGVLSTRRGAGVFVSETGKPSLPRRERKRILSERIDILLSEARQMGVSLGEIVELVRERDKGIEKSGAGRRSEP